LARSVLRELALCDYPSFGLASGYVALLGLHKVKTYMLKTAGCGTQGDAWTPAGTLWITEDKERARRAMPAGVGAYLDLKEHGPSRFRVDRNAYPTHLGMRAKR